ncbi:hypothetical protein A2363_03475 [Candidatus Gottesmanbacteria bacterium RIFOXYB1_FULL_47_11]|uniref:Glycosyltransferase RgtA/B/C/D-like domain-containing protein n=1 Tax=Candidatus Gottesmanbacteria bacterium RIFOXYB1_FULL_47_11 TaxID=1798401 RepID=A0A1F6BGC4_9BACT|nr:MAG: hypothetical protein A2363_03475 [Candidatus Gottesmanbacteria bacterium RIFOXYB1_FULL_47_11]
MKALTRLKPTSILITICVFYIAGYVAHAFYLHKTVYGDGIYYYAWLTLNPSKYSVGPALFWAPAYLLTHNQFIVGFTSVLASLFGLILLWRLLQRYFSQTVSIMAVTAVALATNFLFYGSLDPVNSHALTFFAAVVYLSLLLSRHKQWLAIGAALGFLGLMRTQDLLYGILLIPVLNKKNIGRIFLGFLLAFTPQLVAWQLTSGKFWQSQYFMREGFNFFTPHILGVLFNPQSGLFLWTPMTLIGALGLIAAKKYWFFAVFFAQLLVISSWSTWWQGASYSGRMFVSSLPVLAFGIAALFSRLSKFKFTQAYYLICIILPLSIINVLLITFFLLTR